MNILPKALEALGIASLMVGLVQGLYGSMWSELYFFLGGIAMFFVGRFFEKRHASRNKQ
ncbi:MAG: hypothetical protein ABSF91_14420 [Bacteroidota bacterium]